MGPNGQYRLWGRLRCRQPPTKGREAASGSTKGRKGPPAMQGVRIEPLTYVFQRQSRDKLDDRLFAYKNAISALCSHASTPNWNPELDSEYILDLFLQLVNCLCSSGEINNAIEKVYNFLSSTDRSTDLNPPFLPDLFQSLTNPDKYVLWICCIYLIMYKKLPDTIVQQFECQKELSGIEWNSVQLTPDVKQKAVTLLELATEYIDRASHI
ncbi:tetratricopeptide-like helical domain, zinc-finger domain protein [Tanacetum coccineum]